MPCFFLWSLAFGPASGKFFNNTGAISTTGTGTTTIGAALEGVSDTAVLTVH
jgi:hypothetical protein